MVKIKNESNDIQIVSGFPQFGPGEEREVTKEEAEYLTRNANFKKVKPKKRGGEDKRK